MAGYRQPRIEVAEAIAKHTKVPRGVQWKVELGRVVFHTQHGTELARFSIAGLNRRDADVVAARVAKTIRSRLSAHPHIRRRMNERHAVAGVVR